MIEFKPRLLRVCPGRGPAPRLARMPDQIGPGPVAELDLQGPSYGTAAQRDFGYEPKWTLARGLTDCATWLKTHEA